MPQNYIHCKRFDHWNKENIQTKSTKLEQNKIETSLLVWIV